MQAYSFTPFYFLAYFGVCLTKGLHAFQSKTALNVGKLLYLEEWCPYMTFNLSCSTYNINNSEVCVPEVNKQAVL